MNEPAWRTTSSRRSWAKKAFKEAKIYGDARVVASTEDETFSYIPDCSDLDVYA